ncbi:unnamed protein product [Gordionus sp. m RMFG-2023]
MCCVKKRTANANAQFVCTITAARILKGQLRKSGEETVLSWENFPHVALAKTYNTDHQVPDSSGTATAMFSGVKTKMSVVGLNDSVIYQDCSSISKSIIPSIADWYTEMDKSVGIVTNSRVTHATPSCLYAHSPDRNLEADIDFEVYNVTRSQDPNMCRDIAWQLINQSPGNKLKVVLGGGWKKFATKREEFSDILCLTYPKRRCTENVKIGLKMDKTETNRNNNMVLNRIKILTFGYSNHSKFPDIDKAAKGERNDRNLVKDWIN